MLTLETPPRYDLFISYASVDRHRVLEIVDRLDQLGLSIWIDRSGIAGGTSYGEEIVDAIRSSRSIALMSSEASLTSKNVRQEIMLAWRYGTPMVPLLLEPVSPPEELAYWLEGFPWIDAQGAISEWLPVFVRRLHQHGVALDITRADAFDPTDVNLDIRTNLPSPEGEIHGRQQTIQEIESLLQHGRWITLTGPGGTGKTRLAIEIGRRQLTAHRDGVWFVDLAPADSPNQVLPAIAYALSVDAEGDGEISDLIHGALNERQMLLLFDNFEHVAGAAPELSRLLEDHPGLSILATSRMPLRTTLEWAFEVPQLPPPDASGSSSAAQLAQQPAVALFVERATRAKPDFVLTEGNARAVAEICLRLEGLPLAIELAAARVRLLPPQVLLARLGSRLSLLSRGESSGRHRTLLDTIGWSYDLLEPGPQHLFRQMGVFRGPAALEATLAVSGEAAHAEDIRALVDQSLLRPVRSSADHEFRYFMLETVREYAVLQLEQSGELENARERHARFFASLVARGAEEIAQTGQGQRLAVFRADDANLHAAIEWFGETDSHADEVSMITDLYAYWVRTGRSREADEKLSLALARGDGLPAQLWGRATLSRGRFRAMAGDADTATSFFEQSLEFFTNANDLAGASYVRIEMGRAAARQGELDAAAVHFGHASDGFGKAGWERSRAEAQQELGVLNIYRGDFPAAIEAISTSVENFRKLADLRMVGEALSNLGSAEMLGGDAIAAQKHLQDSLAIFRTQEDAMAVAVLTTNLGRAQQISGDLQGARATLTEALELTREAGDRANEAVTLYGLGLLARSTGDPAEADQLLRQSLEIAWDNGDLWLVVEIVEALALLLIDRDEVETAVPLLGAAMAMREESGTAINPSEQSHFDHAIDLAKKRLGEERFEELLAAGKSQRVEELVLHQLAGGHSG